MVIFTGHGDLSFPLITEFFALVPLPKNDFPNLHRTGSFSSFRCGLQCHLLREAFLSRLSPASLHLFTHGISHIWSPCVLANCLPGLKYKLHSVSSILSVLFNILPLASGILLNMGAIQYKLVNE